MEKPKLENFKREVHDGQDYADWYREYYQALEKYIKFLEKTANNLKEQFSKPEIKLENELEMGDRYYYISSNRIVYEEEFVNESFDVNCISALNAFKTEQEAIKERDRQLTQRRLQRYAEIVNEGWKPNWDDNGKGKYYIGYTNIIDELTVNCCYISKLLNTVYFRSEELVRQAIEYFGDELDNLK